MKTACYLIPILTITVIILIRAEILKIKKQIYIFKPLSTVIVIAVALLSFLEPTRNLTFSIVIVIGLLLSLSGDVALMFTENRKAFTIGLGLFLLAHITYTVIFMVLGRFSSWNTISIIILLTAGVFFYRLISPNLGKMKIPVIVYIIIISVMLSQAVSALGSPAFSDIQALMVIVGAVFFYISDVILAAARFWKPWKYNRISLAFYYTGQLLIALVASNFG